MRPLCRSARCMGCLASCRPAAEHALSLGDAPIAEMREIYRARRDFRRASPRPYPELRCTVPEAGMFMMVDVSATGLSANEFAWALFRATGVSVLDGAAFGAETAKYPAPVLHSLRGDPGRGVQPHRRFSRDPRPGHRGGGMSEAEGRTVGEGADRPAAGTRGRQPSRHSRVSHGGAVSRPCR